ncbi:MAG: hypothetical protein LBT70_02090 [Holosporaceae bacterium]|jgi:hypothetical protein|nr:hypothetical protein [Holosporaceae bacterium]
MRIFFVQSILILGTLYGSSYATDLKEKTLLEAKIIDEHCKCTELPDTVILYNSLNQKLSLEERKKWEQRHVNGILQAIKAISPWEGPVAETFIKNFADSYYLHSDSVLPKKIADFLSLYSAGYYINIYGLRKALEEDDSVFSFFGEEADSQTVVSLIKAGTILRVKKNEYLIGDLLKIDDVTEKPLANVETLVANYNRFVNSISWYIFEDLQYQDCLKEEFVFVDDSNTLLDAILVLPFTADGEIKQNYTAFGKFLNNFDFFTPLAEETSATFLKIPLDGLDDTIKFNIESFQLYLDMQRFKQKITDKNQSDKNTDSYKNFLLAYYQYKYEEFVLNGIIPFITKMKIKASLSSWYTQKNSNIEYIPFAEISKFQADGEKMKEISNAFSVLSSNSRLIKLRTQMGTKELNKQAAAVFLEGMKISLGLEENKTLLDVYKRGDELNTYANQKPLDKSHFNNNQFLVFLGVVSALKWDPAYLISIFRDSDRITISPSDAYQYKFSILCSKAYNEIYGKFFLEESESKMQMQIYLIDAFQRLNTSYRQSKSAETLAPIATISASFFHAFNHCTAARTRTICDCSNLLLSLEKVSNLNCKNLLDIFLNLITNEIFCRLFVFMKSDNILQEDVMSKMHVQKILNGRFGIIPYSGQYAVRTPEALYMYYEYLFKQENGNALIKQAYQDLKNKLSGSFKNSFSGENFDHIVIPELMKNAISPQNMVTELMKEKEKCNMLITSFMETLGQDTSNVLVLDHSQQQQEIFDILRYYGYCVKK